MKTEKNSPKIGNLGKILFLGYFFPIFMGVEPKLQEGEGAPEQGP